MVYDERKSDMFILCYVPPSVEVSSLISPWIVVTITIERVVSVVKPFKVKHIFSVKKSRIYVTLQILIAFGYYAFDLYGLEVVDNTCRYRTAIVENKH